MYNYYLYFKWMLENNEENYYTSALLGSVGNDNYGKLYKELVHKEKIVPLFEEIANENTGICCVYCYDKDRGHITDLGASILISESYMSNNIVNIFKL